MLKPLFNKFIGLQTCNFTKKRLQHIHFPVNIAKFKNTYFEKHLRTAGSLILVIYCKENWIKLFRIGLPDWPFVSFETKSLYFTYYHSYSFVLSLAVNRCYSLSFFVTRCHLLSFVVTCCTTRCHSFYQTMSFVVSRCHSLYNLLSFVTRCHSMSLDVPLVCLFINDHYFIIFCFLRHL